MKRIDPSLPMPFCYKAGEKRFASTYKEFKPDYPHDLIIVNCGAQPETSGTDDVATKFLFYDGLGSDCGTYQATTSHLDYDLVFCFNTIAYFWRGGWLAPVIAAFEQHGPGVYGVTASMENNPHLRTPAIAFSPKVMAQYPSFVNSRQDCIQFESGPENFSLWAERSGYPSKLVTADGVYDRADWRKPPNIFRRGDQSNCLVFDRHTEIYQKASAEEKQKLEKLADLNQA